MTQGAFLTNHLGGTGKTRCDVHGAELLIGEIVGITLVRPDGAEFSFPSTCERCPMCYATLDAMIRFCCKNILGKLGPGARHVERFVLRLKDLTEPVTVRAADL